MGHSQPTTDDIINSRIAGELDRLHPTQLARFEAMRVPPRRVPVNTLPGEYVYIVAEFEGRVLYYSEVEETWGLETPDEAGGVRDTGQFQLRHIMNQLFGAPNIRTCR